LIAPGSPALDREDREDREDQEDQEDRKDRRHLRREEVMTGKSPRGNPILFPLLQ